MFDGKIQTFNTQLKKIKHSCHSLALMVKFTSAYRMALGLNLAEFIDTRDVFRETNGWPQ